MKAKLLLVVCFFSCFSPLIATSFATELEAETKEFETFSFKAKNLVYSIKDVQKLARDAVAVCFHSYRSDFDLVIRQEKSKYKGATKSGACQQMVLRYTKSFACTIIDQVDLVARKLPSFQDEEIFWEEVQKSLTSSMTAYCQSHGSSLASDLKGYISGKISLKRMF